MLENHSNNSLLFHDMISAMYKQHMQVSFGTQKKMKVATSHNVYLNIFILELWQLQVLRRDVIWWIDEVSVERIKDILF
jgi:hypothetical protein